MKDFDLYFLMLKFYLINYVNPPHILLNVIFSGWPYLCNKELF